MLLLLLSRGFDNLLELDDKGDVSARDNGSGLGRFSWLIQISAERLAELLAYISQLLSNRQIGGFPSDTEVAKGATHEQCNAITTRSGKILKNNKEGTAVNPPAAMDKPVKADTLAQAEEDLNIPLPTIGENSAEPSTAQSEEPVEKRSPPPFPQRLKNQKQDYQFKKFLDILKQVHINLPLMEALQQMPNYAKFLKDMVTRKKRIEEFETAAATETCLALMHNKVPAKKTDPDSFIIDCLIGHNYPTKALCDPGASINLMPKSVFQKLGIGEAKPTTVMLLLADHSYVQPEGKIEDILVQVDKFIFPADFLILDCEANIDAPIILGQSFLATGRVLFDFGDEELIFRADQEERLIATLRQHKEALGWTIADIKGINPTICMNKILLDDNHKPTVDAQRRLNQAMKDVVRKEIIKWLDAGIIYPISDSEWVSPVQCVPKKGGVTVISNEKNDLIPTRTVTGWRVFMDYRKLNKATRKDHFHLPFIDQMLDRLVGKQFYCFLDGYSGYNQIAIAPEDQSKTTFTCPYGTFAFRRMPFGLCNAPATFQRCMTAIFSDLNEDCLEIFMDDFSTFGEDFDSCLSNLEKVLKRCKETNLVLNWEKCHFMVDEGIVLGHKISSKGMEVEKAKIEVISKLPPPTTVKGIRSFLGHAVEIEHKAYWAIKTVNMDWETAGQKRLLDINELEEIRHAAYDNAKIYKEKTKKLHDRKILPKEYQPRQQVLLFNSRLKLFPGKLKSRWSGPFIIIHVSPHGAITIKSPKDDNEFKVNGQRLKLYMGAHVERDRAAMSLRDA
ncbi:hypothetical protein GQ457_15G018480 [Hibiscus cannabinus]